MPQNKGTKRCCFFPKTKYARPAAPKITPQNQRSFATPPEVALPLAEFFMNKLPRSKLRGIEDP